MADEAAARACQTILTDTNAIDQVAKDVKAKNPKLFNKIAELLKQIVKRIRNAYKEMFLGSGNDTERQAREMLRTCEAIRDTWVRGALNAGQAMQTLRGEAAGKQAEKNTVIDGVRNSIRRTQDMSWQAQIKGALFNEGNIRRNDTLVIGNVSPEIQDGIVTNKPLAVPLSVLTKAGNGKDVSHSIKRGKLAKLDIGINNAPITIVNPDRNSIAFVTNIMQGGYPVIAAFDLNANFDGDEVHKATSIHLQIDVNSMLDNLPPTATVYIKNENELAAVGATNNLRGLAANIKFISNGIVTNGDSSVNNNKRKASRLGEVGKNFTETPQFRQWFGNSVAKNPDGTPKVLYHQTDAEFTVFDPRHIGAGTSDNGTPFGIFMKSESKNIGLRGDKQMELYASIQNPLIANNREHLYRQISQMSEKYTSILKQRESLDSEYHKRLEDNENAQMEYMKQWREQNPGVSSRQLYNDDFFKSLLDKDETILDEWKAAGKELDKSAKEEINRVLEANGYDGVIIREDAGSFGRKTDAYIALHPEQVKSATDNVGTFDRTNPDIRYSDRNSDPKELQLQAIQEANPAMDDIHTWVRSVSDIHTFREALDADGYESGGMAPDFTDAMIKRAEKTGRIAVYSSNDIGVGTWVTPSKMEAESYAGGGKVFVKNVKLTDVAWVDSMQGQYTGDVQAEKNTADGGVRLATRYDIVDVNGKEYDTVVQLDKHISKRVISSPVKFLDYIVKHFAGQRINVLDKDGNVETLVFAKADDYVSKNGRKRHPVLGELAYTSGSTRKEVIVNLPEVAAQSQYDPKFSSGDNEHDWLDRNGWESRKTYVIADDGKIYEAYLKIGKAEDGRNILYAVNCDATKGIAVDQGATQKRAAVIAAMPSNKKVSHNNNTVNPPNKRKSSRYSAETKAAIDAFRAQTDAAAKAQKDVYEAQIQQMEQSYKRQINTLEAEADDRYNDIRMKFNSIVEQYDAKVMEAGAYDEQRNELMQDLQAEEEKHKSDNEIWQKEFDRLTKEWEASGRSIENLNKKIQQQRKAVYACDMALLPANVRHINLHWIQLIFSACCAAEASPCPTATFDIYCKFSKCAQRALTLQIHLTSIDTA